jgi:hypothetical protein
MTEKLYTRTELENLVKKCSEEALTLENKIIKMVREKKGAPILNPQDPAAYYQEIMEESIGKYFKELEKYGVNKFSFEILCWYAPFTFLALKQKVTKHTLGMAFSVLEMIKDALSEILVDTVLGYQANELQEKKDE